MLVAPLVTEGGSVVVLVSSGVELDADVELDSGMGLDPVELEPAWLGGWLVVSDVQAASAKTLAASKPHGLPGNGGCLFIGDFV
ncbi:MAG: hypothetical protein K0V04_23630 [Deltaproteobacteria bacterium]|nr:hypothetical protein [Deltaproteobacteria bacterium]